MIDKIFKLIFKSSNFFLEKFQLLLIDSLNESRKTLDFLK